MPYDAEARSHVTVHEEFAAPAPLLGDLSLESHGPNVILRLAVGEQPPTSVRLTPAVAGALAGQLASAAHIPLAGPTGFTVEILADGAPSIAAPIAPPVLERPADWHITQRARDNAQRFNISEDELIAAASAPTSMHTSGRGDVDVRVLRGVCVLVPRNEPYTIIGASRRQRACTRDARSAPSGVD
ncbi:hypothetical protein [Glutamicibacter endophyticus]|uniref:hypothetical protein n=1 Tax=Glutamicibacter endophyticus TaxID=1522174 RepID=UPI003AEFD429